MPGLNLQKLLCNRSLLMVGGKGGVGKTTVAAALALRASAMGRRTLIVSTDPAHSLGDAYGTRIGNRETRLAESLSGLEIDPDSEVDAYLEQVGSQMARFAAPEQRGALERQLKLSRLSPGAQEAALLERLSRIIDERRQYDLVIFDTAPTGHTLRLLSLPEVMAAWTDGLLRQNRRSEQLGKVLAHLSPGRDLDSPLGNPAEEKQRGLDERTRALLEPLLERQSRFRRTRRHLQDASESAFLFVLTPERLPILETERALHSLAEAEIPVAGALVNRLLPRAEEASGFMHARWQREQRMLREIEIHLAGVPRRNLPLLADDIQGMDALLRFAEFLR